MHSCSLSVKTATSPVCIVKREDDVGELEARYTSRLCQETFQFGIGVFCESLEEFVSLQLTNIFIAPLSGKMNALSGVVDRNTQHHQLFAVLLINEGNVGCPSLLSSSTDANLAPFLKWLLV